MQKALNGLYVRRHVALIRGNDRDLALVGGQGRRHLQRRDGGVAAGSVRVVCRIGCRCPYGRTGHGENHRRDETYGDDLCRQ